MSSVTGRSVFTPTDSDTIAASHSVGAYVRAGTDGDLIGSETLNALEWLRVAGVLVDSSGNEVSVTTGHLDVNLASADVGLDADMDGVYNVSTNADPDNIGLIVHGRAASPGDSDQTFRTTGGAANSDDVVAANVHGIDVNSFLMGYDGSTWDRITATSGAMDVNVTNTIDLDDDLADTDLLVTKKAVTNTSSSLLASQLSNRKHLAFANVGNLTAYMDKTTATTDGWPLFPGEKEFWRCGPSITSIAVIASAAAGTDVRVLELS